MSEETPRITSAPHRDAPITVTLAEYQALQKRCDDLGVRVEAAEKANARALRWAQRLRDASERAVVAVTIAAVICAVGWAIWWGAIRGRAHGARARRNAEAEAIHYVTMTRGVPPVGVACAPNYPTRDSWFDMTCSVVPPTPKPLRCDSDEPARNDGCVESEWP